MVPQLGDFFTILILNHLRYDLKLRHINLPSEHPNTKRLLKRGYPAKLGTVFMCYLFDQKTLVLIVLPLDNHNKFDDDKIL